MEDKGGVGGRDVGSVFFNGTMFALNDLVHVFVGTGAYLRERQTEVIMGRFKGVRVEKGGGKVDSSSCGWFAKGKVSLLSARSLSEIKIV
jgi:hypothetical protein